MKKTSAQHIKKSRFTKYHESTSVFESSLALSASVLDLSKSSKLHTPKDTISKISEEESINDDCDFS